MTDEGGDTVDGDHDECGSREGVKMNGTLVSGRPEFKSHLHACLSSVSVAVLECLVWVIYKERA